MYFVQQKFAFWPNGLAGNVSTVQKEFSRTVYRSLRRWSRRAAFNITNGLMYYPRMDPNGPRVLWMHKSNGGITADNLRCGGPYGFFEWRGGKGLYLTSFPRRYIPKESSTCQKQGFQYFPRRGREVFPASLNFLPTVTQWVCEIILNCFISNNIMKVEMI